MVYNGKMLKNTKMFACVQYILTGCKTKTYISGYSGKAKKKKKS